MNWRALRFQPANRYFLNFTEDSQISIMTFDSNPLNAPNPIDETDGMTTSLAKTNSPKGTWWSRHQVLVNFWLDSLLLVLFITQAWLLAVVNVVFPRGAGPDWTIWGATPLDWSEAAFATFCLFSACIVLHVMFHWNWICAVVATRLLGRKPGKDDGSHTIIGVCVLVFLIHVILVGILVARTGLVNSKTVHGRGTDALLRQETTTLNKVAVRTTSWAGEQGSVHSSRLRTIA